MSEKPYMRDLPKAQRLILQGKGLGLPLNRRETEIVLAIMEGHTAAKALAAAVGLSQSSINACLYRVYAKSGANNIAHLVLMIAGIQPCPEALQPVQRTWRRKHYQLDKS